MLYTKIQPQSLFGSGDFCVLFKSTVIILLNSAEPFERMDFFDKRPYVKFGELVKQFQRRHLKITRFHTSIQARDKGR